MKDTARRKEYGIVLKKRQLASYLPSCCPLIRAILGLCPSLRQLRGCFSGCPRL
jgi:hypothetical protein